MATILDTIAEYTKERVKKEKEVRSLTKIKSEALSMNCNTGFPFEKALSSQGISFICECKKASPSKGLIAEDFPYLKIAEEYEAPGA